ncbi:MAG: hypothetical protein UEY11_11600 [Evtepia gabavorous]|uniref:hypothetical protein n=1 Tax=Evtepia gabavorous TaxID=2211183 RepID=UPI002E7A6B47|nr:hypothetical protein [Evtepia gabavorous]MEE0067837.1 hypothetical protein [Evtepia gabavorous]
MDIEKLIEAAKLYGIDAADAITALLAENEKLLKMYQEEKAVCHATQAELEKVRESLDFARTKDAELIRLGMELDHLKKHVKRLTHILRLYERKDIVVGRYENGQLWWKVGDREKNNFPNKFFPSIRPSNEFNLIEIIGGAE